jgi:hypothetical protein
MSTALNPPQHFIELKIIIGLSDCGYLIQKGPNTNSSQIVERPRNLIQEHGAVR